MDDLEAARAEIIDINDFLPAAAEDGEDRPNNDDERLAWMAERAELEATLHANFRASRDTFFELDLDARLELRYKRDDEPDFSWSPSTEELPYSQQVYRPRDGDDKNLQLFAESLAVSFAPQQLAEYDYSPANLSMFLRLSNGGLVWIRFTFDNPCFIDNYKLYVNGEMMEDSGLLLEIGSHSPPSAVFDLVLAHIFLPQARMQKTERLADCDTVLDFVTRRLGMDQDCFLAIQSSRHNHLVEQVDEYFSPSNWRAYLERVHKRELYLRNMRLSEEMWRDLSTIECDKFEAENMLVPQLFWRQTRAKEITHRDSSEEALEFALLGLESRLTPIDTVYFYGLCYRLETVSDADKWASALSRVRRVEISPFYATKDAWRSFWLSKTMAENISLVSISLMSRLLITDFSGDLFDELPPWLSVIRECLQHNLFLEHVTLPLFRDRQRWNDHVLPLLEMNRRHEHRLTPGETRLSAIQGRLLQIYRHPKKLFRMLQDYARDIIPLSESERASDLEQSKDDAIGCQVRAEDTHLWAEVAKTSRELNRQQAQLDSEGI